MKKNIAVIAGGNSSEFPVSIRSAGQIAGELDPDKYNVYKIIVKGTDWTLEEDETGQIPVDKNDFSCDTSEGKLKFDCALITIHGTPGEDGKLQGYFESLDIPYTTSGILASSLTFNKKATKLFLNQFGILSPASVYLNKGESFETETIIYKLGLPVFVKPNQSGSSFGITKVNNANLLKKAINHAFEEDDEIIIEEFIEGTEVTCGLLKTASKEVILPLCEILSKNEFFDYEAKYTPSKADEIIPARIPQDKTKECQTLALYIYSVVGCRGIVRIDFILSGEKFYFLEINTIPGMSAESIVPKMAREYGINLKELFTLVIEDAFTRHQKGTVS
ncbi:MAG: D-alanine--D-alanine ligase [Bacteroidetes bacterium]|nr:D-alanine--D-alanine ligase [Bacteroidota bacterium]